MSNSIGSQDDEMTRREELRQERLREATENAAVAGSSPFEGNSATCDGADAEEMLAAYKRTNDDDTTMTKEKQKLKSPRYSDVPAYDLEEIDMEILREEVFPGLDFTESEKEVAGVIAKNDVSGLSQSEIGDLAGVSKSTAGNAIRKLETRRNPSQSKRIILGFARENPHLTPEEIAEELDEQIGEVRRILSAYRHERIVCEVEVKEDCDENEEKTGQTTEDDKEGIPGDESPDDESTKSDVVQKDTTDEDEEYKYDTNSTIPQTRDGKELTEAAIDDAGDLLEIFREQERRLQELEAKDAEEVPDWVEGRFVSVESRLEGVQSVVDRIEDQQMQVERFVEEELGEDADLSQLEDDVQDLKEDIDDLRGRVSSVDTSTMSFTAEEKKEVIVALAENGQNDLIEKVIEEL